ncbi:MAG: ribonuclease III [Oscillospiraceae bacterium]|nr:ribonuclease III [Oscillospiraceae bacterium]
MLPEHSVLSVHEAKQKSPVELAFIGDAVYELLVREHISITHDAPASALHKMAIAYVRAEAQHTAMEKIAPELSDDEADIARRGRNANKVTSSKHAAPADYRAATGLETLFGFLYLTGDTDRIRQLFAMIVED